MPYRIAHRKRLAAALILALLSLARTGHAVIVCRENRGRNLEAPAGALAGSGWQWQGDWHGFPATVIGPHHFLAAKHTGGLPLQPFRFRGQDYYTVESTPVPHTDLTLWRVVGTFPDWAPLYTGQEEVKRAVVLFGRGGERGKPVLASGQRRGWYWGAIDGRLSWGQARIIATLAAPINTTRLGDLLAWRFDKEESGVGDDTACVSGGDSGGGVFLQDAGTWKLAGVINGVDRSYAVHPNTKGNIPACLYDARGLYRVTPTGSFYIDPAGKERSPTSAFASRVSPYVPFLQQAMRRPPVWPFYGIAGLGVLCLPPFWFLARRRRRRRLAALEAMAAMNAAPPQTGTQAVNAADTPP